MAVLIRSLVLSRLSGTPPLIRSQPLLQPPRIKQHNLLALYLFFLKLISGSSLGHTNEGTGGGGRSGSKRGGWPEPVESPAPPSVGSHRFRQKLQLAIKFAVATDNKVPWAAQVV